MAMDTGHQTRSGTGHEIRLRVYVLGEGSWQRLRAWSKTMGYCDDIDEDVRRVVLWGLERGLNARQPAAKSTGAYGTGENVTFPEGLEGQPPEKPNVYSDGGVQHPNSQDWSLGGFGIWQPKVEGHEQDEENAEWTRKEID